MPDTDFDTREVLRRALVDEPDFSYDLDAVVTRGRSGRRRRRARVGSLAAVGVCAVAGVAFVLTPGLIGRTSPGHTAAIPGSGGDSANEPAIPADDQHQPPPPVRERPTNALDRQVATAVIAASPTNFTFDLHNGESSSGGVDGTAGDGDAAAAAGFSVGLSTGSQQLHPCSDAEFVSGGTCTERTLDSGAVLSQRGLATKDGIQSVQVVLTYPDGSGINADSSNAVYTKTDPARGSKPVLVPVRAHPTYTVAELTAVVLAVDAALT